ncbi:MAG: matrixin family metalloprotease [Candidatus Pristimantibacillus lignocellulolyticus]|uniref:Matrixin family metalloprotease n=1 Tax=Candidatus Pristimantibacillus lignocellulolyticus TaxID=2994561 RepID=A0A9J6ZEM6_9BACL|nr:MAG: matrixin family metalloprotease [Candidatus Pristimantibacillus lignocellulolyticus]
MSYIKSRKKKIVTGSISVLLGLTLLVTSSPVSATVTTFGKWSSRTQTMYAVTTASQTHWSNGAAKWKNNTTYNISVASGLNSTYYSLDVNKSDVDWDGLCTFTVNNGIISKAILNLNTHYTSQSKYTSSIIAGVTGHEIGHSLGLEHTSVVETSSIMHPYTFNDNGTLARALSPSTSDKTVVNNLYPLSKLAENRVNLELSSEDIVIHLEPSWAVYYEDEAALTKAADLVIRGTVTDTLGNQAAKGNYSNYNTLVNIEVSEVIKGSEIVGDNITVSQMGGTDGKVDVYSDSSTHLEEKQEVLLFLRQSNDGTFRPINEDDSIYVLKDGAFNNIATEQVLNEKKLFSE